METVLSELWPEAVIVVNLTTDAKAAKIGMAICCSVSVRKERDGMEKSALSVEEIKSGIPMTAVHAHKAHSCPESGAKDQLNTCAESSPTPIGTNQRICASASPASQLSAISACARKEESYMRISAIDVPTDPTPSSTMESANATKDTLSMERNACQTERTAPTLPATAMWDPTSTLSRRNVYLAPAVASPALTATDVIPVLLTSY